MSGTLEAMYQRPHGTSSRILARSRSSRGPSRCCRCDRDRSSGTTHDHKRNGTVDLYAALEVATGVVTGRTTERHRAKEFLDFCRVLVRRYPAGELHVVLDNSSTHKTRRSDAGCAGTSGSTSTVDSGGRRNIPIVRSCDDGDEEGSQI